MTYDQFLSHLSTHTGTFRFSYPGNKRGSITAERQIIFACDGTPVGFSIAQRRGRIGRGFIPVRPSSWKRRFMKGGASVIGGAR